MLWLTEDQCLRTISAFGQKRTLVVGYHVPVKR